MVVLSTLENAVISFKNPVTDTDEVDVNRMFDRFYTGDRARRKTTGLDLSIVKLLTEQMGGVITASLHECELRIQVELPLSR